MSQKKRRREAFLKQHPYCCFCGGDKIAVTIDHVPSRQMFDGRKWPEGYEFPACENCNAATKDAEQILAFLAHSNPDSDTEEDERKFTKILQAVANNYPELIVELKPSPVRVRKFLRSRNIKKNFGEVTTEMPLLDLDGPIMSSAVNAFGFKLVCALHYKHTSRIIPCSGGILVHLYPNTDVIDGKITEEFYKLTGYSTIIKRCNTSLEDQFYYRYNASHDGKLGVYLAFFRLSFVLAGFVNLEAGRFPHQVRHKVLSPQPSGSLDRLPL